MSKAALVTGGAKRIGRAVAEALARAGYDVALHYHSSRAEAQELAGQIEALGRKCRLFPCDLGDMKAVSDLMPAVFEAFGDCNLLINNAAVFEAGGFMETDETNFDAHFNVNLKAPLLLSRAFAGLCKGGQIINILDSRVARMATDHFAYTLSKKALADMTKMAAKALAPTVRVNAVCPGLILSPEGQAEKFSRRMLERVPLGRTGSPEDVAKAVMFLVENEFITGQLLFVDGGEALG